MDVNFHVSILGRFFTTAPKEAHFWCMGVRMAIAEKQHTASQQLKFYPVLVSRVVAGAPSNFLTEIFIIFFKNSNLMILTDNNGISDHLFKI